MQLNLCTLFYIKEKEFRMNFHPSHLSKKLWLRQYLQDKVFDQDASFFRHYLKPGDICVDVGANVGFFTLLSSALVGPSGKVYAFEPNPQVYKYLEANLALNQAKNVISYNIAIGDKDIDARLSVPRKKDDHGYITSDNRGLEIPISMKKLDSMDIENGSISLIKLDIEGYEKFALEGAHNLLKNAKCVYFEALSLNTERYGYTISDLLNILKENGFDTFELHNNQLKNTKRGIHHFSTNLISTRDISDLLKRTNYRH